MNTIFFTSIIRHSVVHIPWNACALNNNAVPSKSPIFKKTSFLGRKSGKVPAFSRSHCWNEPQTQDPLALSLGSSWKGLGNIQGRRTKNLLGVIKDIRQIWGSECHKPWNTPWFSSSKGAENESFMEKVSCPCELHNYSNPKTTHWKFGNKKTWNNRYWINLNNGYGKIPGNIYSQIGSIEQP